MVSVPKGQSRPLWSSDALEFLKKGVSFRERVEELEKVLFFRSVGLGNDTTANEHAQQALRQLLALAPSFKFDKTQVEQLLTLARGITLTQSGASLEVWADTYVQGTATRLGIAKSGTASMAFFLADSLLREETMQVPGTLAYLRYLAPSGYTSQFFQDSTSVLANILPRILRPQGLVTGVTWPSELLFISDAGVAEAVSPAVRENISGLNASNIFARVGDLARGYGVDRAVIVGWLPQALLADYWRAADQPFIAIFGGESEAPRICAAIREEFCDKYQIYAGFTFAGFNQLLAKVVEKIQTDFPDSKFSNDPTMFQTIGQYLQAIGCPPFALSNTYATDPSVWSVYEWVAKQLRLPANLPSVQVFHDLLVQGVARGLCATPQPDKNASDALAQNPRVASYARVRDKHTERKTLGKPEDKVEKETLAALGARLAKFVQYVKAYLRASGPSPNPRSVYAGGAALWDTFYQWFMKAYPSEDDPVLLKVLKSGYPGLYAFADAFEILIEYVGGRLEFARQYRDDELPWWRGSPADPLDLYQFYLELAHLLSYVNLSGRVLSGDAKVRIFQELLTKEVTPAEKGTFARTVKQIVSKVQAELTQEGSTIGLQAFLDAAKKNDWTGVTARPLNKGFWTALFHAIEGANFDDIANQIRILVEKKPAVKSKVPSVPARIASLIWEDPPSQSLLRKVLNLQGLSRHFIRSHGSSITPAPDYDQWYGILTASKQDMEKIAADRKDRNLGRKARSGETGFKAGIRGDTPLEILKGLRSVLERGVAGKYPLVKVDDILWTAARLNNGRSDGYILNASEVGGAILKNVIEGKQDKPGLPPDREPIRSSLSKVAGLIEKQQEKDIKDNTKLDAEIAQMLPLDVLSFCHWGCLKWPPIGSTRVVREKLQKLSPESDPANFHKVSTRFRAFRNCFDLKRPSGGSGAFNPPLDDRVLDFPAELGQSLNIKRFLPRWRQFEGTVRSAFGKEWQSTGQIPPEILLLHQLGDSFMTAFVTPFPIASGSGEGDNSESSKQRFFIPFEHIPGVTSDLRVAQGVVAKLKVHEASLGAANAITKLYPSFWPFWEAPRVPPPPAQQGGDQSPSSPSLVPPQDQISPSRLIGAVLKALVAEFELRKASGGGDASATRLSLAKCLRLVYLHESLEGITPESEAGKDLIKRGFPPGGFGFLAYVPAIFPRREYLEAVGELLNPIAGNEDSLEMLDPTAQDESLGGQIFDPMISNFTDIGRDILCILAILRLRISALTDLLPFIQSAELFWTNRLEAREEAEAVEGEEGEGEEEDEEEEEEEGEGEEEDEEEEIGHEKETPLHSYLQHYMSQLILQPPAAPRKVSARIPLSITAGKESLALLPENINDLRHLTNEVRIKLLAAQALPSRTPAEKKAQKVAFREASSLRFRLQGGPLIAPNKWNLRNEVKGTIKDLIVPDVKPDVQENVEKKLRAAADAWKGSIQTIEDQMDAAWHLDVELERLYRPVRLARVRERVVRTFLLAKNRLITSRSWKVDLVAINKKLKETLKASQLGHAKGDVKLSQEEREVIKTLWVKMNGLLKGVKKYRGSFNAFLGENLKDADHLILSFFSRKPAAKDSNSLLEEFKRVFTDVGDEPAIKDYIDAKFRQVLLVPEIVSGTAKVFLTNPNLGSALARLISAGPSTNAFTILHLSPADVQALYPDDPLAQIEFYKAKTDTFLRTMHRFQAIAYQVLDQRERKLEKPAKKPPKTPRRTKVQLREARKQALKFLLESEAEAARKYRDYLKSKEFKIAIQIPRNQANRILASEEVAITRIQVLPPPASGQRAVASIMLEGPSSIIHPASAMMKKFSDKHFLTIKKGNKDIRWGQDTNRPYCPWMATFNRVDAKGTEVSLAQELAPDYILAWLAGLGHPADRTSIRKYAAHYLDQAKVECTRFLRRPLPEHPCHLRADAQEGDMTIHEQLGMVPLMREARRVRLLEEIRLTRRRRSFLNKPKDKELKTDAPAREAHQARVRSKLRKLNGRFDHLRDEMLADAERITAYMIYHFNITRFAYEKVKFSPWGKLGGLSKIQRAMLKNPGDLISGAQVLFERAGINWPVEEVEAVPAAGTSQVVIDENKKIARPDRRMSADWPIALFWDDSGNPVPRILRSHVQSAAEIARRAEKPASQPKRPSIAGVRFIMSLNWPLEEKIRHLRASGVDDPLSYGDGPPPSHTKE